MSAERFFTEDDLIYQYTRREAIQDGVLVDVSEMAREAGIRFPVAVTAALWYTYIVPSEEMEGVGQSTKGRLWDCLFLFAMKARKSNGSEFLYEIAFLMEEPEPETIQIKAHCGPGDDGAPVITLMLPYED